MSEDINNSYDNQLIRATKKLHSYSKFRAENKYTKQWEIDKLNEIIQTLVTFHIKLKNREESIIKLEKEKENASIICMLTGITKETLSKLLNMYTWFLKKELNRVMIENDYLQFPIDFTQLEIRYNSTLSLIESDIATVEGYKTFNTLLNNSTVSDIQENYKNIISQIEIDYVHLSPLFSEIRQSNAIPEDLTHKIEEIYEEG